MLSCRNTKIKCRVPLVCVDMPVEGRSSSSELRHVRTLPQGHVTSSLWLGFPHCVLPPTSSTGATKRNRIHGMLVVYWRALTVLFSSLISI